MFGQNSCRAIALSSVLSVSTVITLPLAQLAFAPAAFAQSTTRFSDVQSSYWASQYVRALTDANIISGFPDATFRPDAQMTRAQFASILSGGFPKAAVRSPITFTDVPANHWAAGAIASAYAKGFLSGYPDGTFGLDKPITRLEVLIALANGLELQSPTNAAQVLAVFSDRAQIPAWATGAIAAATSQQLIVNYPTVQQLNPNRFASRAEIAAIAYQALVSKGRATALNSPYVPIVATTGNPAPTDDFSDLVASLSSNNPSIQRAAADSLVQSGAAAVPDLALALESDSAPTRAAAAYALNEIGAPAAPATQSLLEVIQDDNELVRALATSALTKVGLDQDVLVAVLVAAVQNESGLVKDIAAEALVGIGKDAVPALGNLLQSPSANNLAKQTAATLIGDINQIDNLGQSALQSAIPILAETLNNSDSNVRKAAAGALGDFGPLANVAIPALSRALLGNNSDLSQTVAGSLLKIGPESVPVLTAALTSGNALTRLYAADALWTLTQDSSLILPTLVSLLSTGDVKTRELATLGLTYLGRQALPAVPALRQLVGSNNQRLVSAAQLALLILNNNNNPAATLGLLLTDTQTPSSVPAVFEAISRLWS